MGAPKQAFHARSARMEGKHIKFKTFVKYSLSSEGEPDRQANFADVSESGMRIVARGPSGAQVGDLVQVEFTVPGSSESIKNTAQVVRRVNEFVFAVRFQGLDQESRAKLGASIDTRLSRARYAFITQPWSDLKSIWVNNKQGLIISGVALVLFGILGYYIFINSDEHLGHALRAWGVPYPKQWDLYYVKKFNGDS